ncbi:MAG: tetratricopeptide repeat protein [Cyanobacteria bacterium J06597_1]
MVADPQYKYDIFLRYNRAQSRWSRQLAERLDREGIKVWFDRWMLDSQDNRSVELRRAIDECRTVALVLSNDFVADAWPSDQLYCGFPHAPASQNQRLLPIIFEPCELPRPVQNLPAINFSGSEEDPILFEFRVQQLIARFKPGFEAPTDLQRFRLQSQVSQLATIGTGDIGTSDEVSGFRAFVRGIQQLVAQVLGNQDMSADEQTRQVAFLQFIQRLFQWNTADIQFEKGEELFEQGNFEKAIAAYDRALNIDSNVASAWSRRGDALVELGRYREAIDSYNGSLSINPYDEAVRMNLALILGQMGRHKAAVVNYDKVIESDPEQSTAWHNRGVRLMQLGRMNLALKSFETALEQSPDRLDTWIARGYLLRSLERNRDALGCFTKALEIQPKNRQLWIAQGNTLMSMGRSRKALIAYNTALKLDPYSAEAWHNRGLLLLKLKRYRDAVTCFDRAYRFNPDSYRTWYARGYAFQQLGLQDEALVHFEESARIDPDRFPARYAQASTLLDIGKYKAAAKRFDRLLEEQPDDATVLYQKAMSLRRLERWKEAIATSKQILTLNEHDPMGWFALGTIYSDAGDLEAALKSYAKVLECDPADAIALNNRAWVLCRLERYEEAEEFALQAAGINEEKAAFWHTLATIQAGLDKIEQAIASYSRVLELDPNFEAAQLAIDQLKSLQESENAAEEPALEESSTEPVDDESEAELSPLPDLSQLKQAEAEPVPVESNPNNPQSSGQQ